MSINPNSPEAEIIKMKTEVDKAKAEGATESALIALLVRDFGFAEEIAKAEVEQGFPIFQQLDPTNHFFDTDGDYDKGKN